MVVQSTHGIGSYQLIPPPSVEVLTAVSDRDPALSPGDWHISKMGALYMGDPIPCMVYITEHTGRVTTRAHIQQQTDIVLLNEQ